MARDAPGEIRIWRIATLAVVVEVLNVGILVAWVALSGSAETAQTRAEQAGQISGPVGGVALCFAGAWWLTRRSNSRQLSNGLLLGAGAATIDLLSLIPLGARVQWLFALSMAGRMAAGALGGWVARISRRS